MFDVISIGTGTRDVYLINPPFKVVNDKKHLGKMGFPAGEATCFALGSKMEVADIFFTTGGGAVNAAATFARQGLHTGALIAVGDDGHGGEVLRELKKEKISVLPVVRKGSHTAYSVLLLGKEGERAILMYRNPEDNLRLRDIPFGKLRARWAYLATGTIDLQTLEGLVKRLRKAKVRIAMNPSKHTIAFGKKKLGVLFERVNAVIVNREEASVLTGVPYEQPRKTFVKLHGLVPGIAVMTEGAKGAMVSDGFTFYEAGVFKDKGVVDRTGAGDAFASGFVAGLIHRNEECRLGLCDEDNVKYAIRLATANATAKIEQMGGKTGLLTSKKFENSPRWKSLEVRTRPL
jgi:ribokinase